MTISFRISLITVRLVGFGSTSSIWYFQAFYIYSCSVCPVIATIIGCKRLFNLTKFLIFSDASYPSIIGIEQSININPYEYYFF